MGLLSRLVDTAVTLDFEVSPRRLDLVGVSDLPEVFASVGKVNQRGDRKGMPLSIPRLSNLSRTDPTFPKPWVQKSLRRFWRRADVIAWAKAWDQKDGPRFRTPPESRPSPPAESEAEAQEPGRTW